MSKAGEEEEDDDEERFHDSLDRLLSSASCSCSASDPEEDYDASSNCSTDYHVYVPRFPRGVSQNYDIWTSQPSSVEQRRIRLLCQMGLARDPSLLHPRSPLRFSTNHLIRNAVPDDENAWENTSGCVKGCRFRSNRSGRPSGIARSRSHGDCACKQYSEICFTCSIACGVGKEENDDGRRFFRGSACSEEASRSGNRSPDRSSVSFDKFPKIGSDNKDGVIFGDLIAMDRDVECHGLEHTDEVCIIKNLDNGKEFVVNKFREDGSWEKIKEVETGRQLTMEEFSSEMCVGTSPIVQELMRRQKVEDGSIEGLVSNPISTFASATKLKKRSSWLKSIKNAAISVTGHKERRSGDERDTSSEKGGRRSSSATDDSQDVSCHGTERVRVRQYGKSVKDLTSLFKIQEIQAHNGSIWAIQFSLDGKYLASAGEDRVIHVWQVMEADRKEDLLSDKFEDGNLQVLFFANGSPEPSCMSPSLDGRSEKKRRGRSSFSRKTVSPEQIMVPETVFALSDKPMCSLEGHSNDVLDLSWSKSQQLLSSSMDKTVRLWDLSSRSCLKIFSHNDYVTCIQFNPVDDRYFISGSIDAKVRIWSIPDHQVVDWSDLHEMVTAACYTPDGQGALVGSYKGSCRLYNISENKLLHKSQVNLQNKKKRSHQKKITGFKFSPRSTSEVIITSADSRIRVIDGVDLVHKFKGFRNTNSQISASVTSNGKYVISASEDSYVYIWRHEVESQPNRSTKVGVTRSYEVFHCQDVSVAIPWPGISPCRCLNSKPMPPLASTESHHRNMVIEDNEHGSPLESGCTNSPVNVGGGLLLPVGLAPAPNGCLFDRTSATWPEEKLVSNAKNRGVDISNRSAWGMVIVTAGLRGELKAFQNFGLPVRI